MPIEPVFTDGYDELSDVLGLIDVDPDAIRAAELAEARSLLDTMVGKTIETAFPSETRIIVKTEDGSRFSFYGLIGRGP
jgi:hypothetical protein